MSASGTLPNQRRATNVEQKDTMQPLVLLRVVSAVNNWVTALQNRLDTKVAMGRRQSSDPVVHS